MKRSLRNHSSKFKARVAVEALRGDATVAQFVADGEIRLRFRAFYPLCLQARRDSSRRRGAAAFPEKSFDCGDLLRHVYRLAELAQGSIPSSRTHARPLGRIAE